MSDDFVAPPEELSYLAPAARAFSTVPPDEFNEDLDQEPVRQALRNRVKGLSKEDAQRLLAEDADRLKDWLDAGDAEDTRLAPYYFILGVFMGIVLHGAVDKLRAGPPAPRDFPDRIQIEAPPEWKVIRQRGCVEGKCKKVRFSIAEASELVFQRLLDRVRRAKKPGAVREDHQFTWERVAVEFGPVSGTKLALVQTAPFFRKKVDYLLQVPGGKVSVYVSAGGKRDFDEGLVEGFLHTLRVVSE